MKRYKVVSICENLSDQDIEKILNTHNEDGFELVSYNVRWKDYSRYESCPDSPIYTFIFQVKL